MQTITVLFTTLATLLLIHSAGALPTWDQLESVLEEQNSTDWDAPINVEEVVNPASHDLIIDAIEKATDTIRRDLAVELDAMLEKLPVIMQGTPPPAQAVQPPRAPRPVDAKANQQLVWGVDAGNAGGNTGKNPRPPQRPRPLPPKPLVQPAQEQLAEQTPPPLTQPAP